MWKDGWGECDFGNCFRDSDDGFELAWRRVQLGLGLDRAKIHRHTGQ